ncbi:MAG: DUF4203 domain-containing protein [Clostridiaceae bacterium]|nr:DUF4203 domain-containing protein [Clostridiaceae bacterium]
MGQLYAWTDQALYLLTLVLGLVVCFWGYRLFRFWLILAGLQTGFFFGFWLGDRYLDNTVLVLVIAGLCAVLIAALAYTLLKLGAFICGAAVCALLAALVMQLFLPAPYWPVLAGAALIGGLLGLFSVKPFLILATAVNGAYLVADGVFNLLAGYPIGSYLATHEEIRTEHLILLLVGILLLTILGVLFQSRMDKRKSAKMKIQADSAKAAATPAMPAAAPEAAQGAKPAPEPDNPVSQENQEDKKRRLYDPDDPDDPNNTDDPDDPGPNRPKAL